MTKKQQNLLKVISENPGITTAELHRQVGYLYAHGVNKYTYSTVHRMIRTGLVQRTIPTQGLRGVGLKVGWRA